MIAFAVSSAVAVAWEGVPNWIVAGTGVVTLIAAVTAAVFAGRAAYWTKEQAQSSHQQTTTTKSQLELALTEAREATVRLEEQREEARRAERRQTEARLDALAPTVLARARRAGLTFGTAENLDLEMLSHPMRIEHTQQEFVFQTQAIITFRNVSSAIARIDILSSAHDEVSVGSGKSIILGPGEKMEVSWHRNIPSMTLRTEEDLGRPENWLLDLRFWARDLGTNVRDEFRFSGDFRHFRLDGSRLLVNPELEFPWDENTAEPTGPRLYERLDAGLDGISPAGGTPRQVKALPGRE